jgi:hypothetical protein
VTSRLAFPLPCFSQSKKYFHRSVPKAASGRLVASGAYIGAFQLTTVPTALMNDDMEKDANGKVTRMPKFSMGHQTKSVEGTPQVFGLMRSR